MAAPRPATRGQELARAASILRAAGAPEPAESARLLWQRAADESPTELALRLAEPADPARTARFRAWIERHARGEPLAYLEGRCGFHGLDLWCDARALVPRADSEALIECALGLLPGERALRVADLGTGSGCLLLALLHARPAWRGVGVDRSRDALALARANAERLGLQERANFVRGSWLEALRGPFELVVANPPYVAPGEPLGHGVAEFEPHQALFAPAEDPLAAYAAILARARVCVAPHGALVFEVGAGRAEAVAALAQRFGWREVERRRDLGGIERALAFRALAAC